MPGPRRLLLLATPFLLLVALVSGILLLRSQVPNADAAQCTPQVALRGGSVSPTNVAQGSSATITAQLSSTCGRTVMLAFDVYDGTGALAWQGSKKLTLYRGSHSYTNTWQVSASQATGSYEVRIGVFSPTWQTLYGWFNKAATFTVASAGGSGTGGGGTGGPPPPSSFTGIHVSGNQLVDANGHAVRLLGADKSGSEYACIQGWGFFSGPSDAAFVQQMVARHVHIVRLPLNESCWLGINLPNGGAYAGVAYQNAVKSFVGLLNTAGIYAILDLQWVGQGGSSPAQDIQQMPDADHAPAFWTSVAKTFSNQSGVLFDLYNEPHDVDWACWKSGGCASQTGYQPAGMQQLVDAVRGTGAHNVVLVEGLAWANDLTGMLANWPNDPDHNIAASVHIYPGNPCQDTSCWQSQMNSVAASVPLIVGEFGAYTDTSINLPFGDSVVKWADATPGVAGYLAWTYNSGFGTSSILQDNDTDLTTYGQWYMNLLATEDKASGTPPPPAPSPSPTATATASATPTSTGGGALSQPPAGGATPVGAALPTEAQCAAAVPASSWEPRSDNYTANHTVPTAAQISGLAHWGYNDAIGMSTQADVLRQQITGNYTGTTDQILQWAACKWGIDPNIARAQATVESWWHMSQLGDWTSDTSLCPSDGAFGNGGCYQSYGILQVRWEYSKTAWPMSRNDTAFSAEYVYGIMRACYEGWMPWLSSSTPLAGYPSYHAGDIWGCLGYWNSGGWYNQQAVDYINKVKEYVQSKPWLQSGF